MLKKYYEILDLALFESSQEAIKVSYKELTAKYHPALYSGKDVQERLIEINEAFLVLSDPEVKKEYDAAISTNDYQCNQKLATQLIAKHNKAETFISSYFNNTKKKKSNFWKIVGTIFLILIAIGNIGRCISLYSQQNPKFEIQNTTAVTLPHFSPPSNWNCYTIDNSFSIYIPPTLELRSEYDIYTQLLRDHFYGLSNSDARFQQKGLGSMDDDAFNTYCRIITERFYVGTNNADHHTASPQLTHDDYIELRNIADDEVQPWHYISEPSYEWIDIDGTKAIDISYTRNGAEGEVICHIYIFFNYDEIVKIVTAYRKIDERIWAQDIDNVIKTFKWAHPK